jgi:hypothetical protein
VSRPFTPAGLTVGRRPDRAQLPRERHICGDTPAGSPRRTTPTPRCAGNRRRPNTPRTAPEIRSLIAALVRCAVAVDVKHGMALRIGLVTVASKELPFPSADLQQGPQQLLTTGEIQLSNRRQSRDHGKGLVLARLVKLSLVIGGAAAFVAYVGWPPSP